MKEGKEGPKKGQEGWNIAQQGEWVMVLLVLWWCWCVKEAA